MKRALPVVMVFALVAVANAYAPSSSYVLNLVIGKRMKQKLDAIKITVKRTDYKDGVAEQPIDVVTVFKQGGKVRSEWTDKEGKHVRLNDATRALAVDADKKQKVPVEPDLFNALWSTGSEGGEKDLAQERGMTFLRTFGVPEAPVSFTRMDGRVAWVLGTDQRSLDVPQVWVDKDEFLILRVVHRDPINTPAPVVIPDGGVAPDAGKPVPAAISGSVIDTRYHGWGSAIGGDFYPNRIEHYRDNVLMRVDELVKVDVTPKLEERDFKLE